MSFATQCARLHDAGTRRTKVQGGEKATILGLQKV
jgi:hypothetical protein